jgi:hypothetical protein
LLPVKDVNGTGYVVVTDSLGIYTVSVTGLQPSGSYAASVHTHTSSDITNFNSAVSGLLPSTPYIFASGGGTLTSGTATFSITNNLVSGTIIPQSLSFKFGQSVYDLSVNVTGLVQPISITGVSGVAQVYYNNNLIQGSVITSGSPSSFDVSVTYTGMASGVTTSIDLYVVGIKV